MALARDVVDLIRGRGAPVHKIGVVNKNNEMIMEILPIDGKRQKTNRTVRARVSSIVGKAPSGFPGVSG
jgi:hypothetical protein